MIEIEVFDEMFDYMRGKYLSDCYFQNHLNHHLFLYQIYQNDVLKRKDEVELFLKRYITNNIKLTFVEFMNKIIRKIFFILYTRLTDNFLYFKV